MYRQLVGGQHAVSRAEVERQPVIAGEVHASNAYQYIETTVHGGVATEIDLARQEVVAQREAVIREASLISRQQFDVAAEVLETGPAGGRLTNIRAEEEVFCHVVGDLARVHRVGAEVLDGEESGAQADLPVLVVD